MASLLPITAKIHFKKLDPSKPEIRLLELQPAHNITDGIVCRLVNVTLTEDLEFIGLSVLYGDPSTSEQIVFNGGRISVPATLGQALRNVRAVFLESVKVTDHEPEEQSPTLAAKKGPRWLSHHLKGVRSILPDAKRSQNHPVPLRFWVDALCIDPRDAREQSGRRSHMAMVFESARMVVGWLGEKDETSDLALEIMRTVDKCMPLDFGDSEDRKRYPENYAPEYKWMAEMMWLWDIPAEMGDPTQFPVFIAINRFLTRPYMQRDWILEDIALASFPALLMGDEIVSWMQMLRLNRNNEELIDNEAALFPPEYRKLIHVMPLSSAYILLKEYERRRQLAGARANTSLPPKSSSDSSKKR